MNFIWSCFERRLRQHVLCAKFHNTSWNYYFRIDSCQNLFEIFTISLQNFVITTLSLVGSTADLAKYWKKFWMLFVLFDFDDSKKRRLSQI